MADAILPELQQLQQHHRSSASSIGDDAGGAQNIIRPPLQASTNFSKAKSYLN
jgi:hypothetical protein